MIDGQGDHVQFFTQYTWVELHDPQLQLVPCDFTLYDAGHEYPHT